MSIGNWSLARLSTFIVGVALAVIALAGAQQAINRRRAEYTAMQRALLPDGKYMYDEGPRPPSDEFYRLFSAKARLNGLMRATQIVAALLLCVALLAVWRWFDPFREPWHSIFRR
jgi:hypothetical protein